MLSPILALFARISKPLRLNIHSTGAEVAGGQKTFLAMDAALCTCHCVSLQPKGLSLAYEEWPRPRPKPRLWGSKTKTKTKTPRFKTETETKTCKNGSRDVSTPRLKSRELQVCWDIDRRLFRFVTIHVSDRRMDGQTDRQNCDSNIMRCITCSRAVKIAICKYCAPAWYL